MISAFEPTPFDRQITRRIARRDDIYDIYEYGLCQENYEVMKKIYFVERSTFDDFMSDTREDAAHMCFLRVSGPPQNGAVGIRLALRQLAIGEAKLRLLPGLDASPRVRRNQRVLFAQASEEGGRRRAWTSLVKDVAAKLCSLTQNATHVDEPFDVERGLAAIEAAPGITSPGRPAKHYFFVEGIDRAYDRNSGYELTETYRTEHLTPAGRQRLADRFAPTQADIDQQGQVWRLAAALSRLFAGGKGKVVFLVGSDFMYCDQLIPRGQQGLVLDLTELRY